MKIDDYYTLENDSNCWTLSYREESGFNKKTGRPIVSQRNTYHMTIKQALMRYIDDQLKDCEQLNEIIKRIDDAEKRISESGILSRPDMACCDRTSNR